MFRRDHIFTNVAYHSIVFVVRRLFIAPMVLITLMSVQTLISFRRYLEKLIAGASLHEKGFPTLACYTQLIEASYL